MTNRLQIAADDGLLKEVSELLEPGEELPSRTQLERWRQGEYIPSERDGWGRTSTLRYPPGTSQQVVALMRELRSERSLDRAALALFFADEPYRLGARALRPAVAAAMERFRSDMEKYAGTYGGPRSRPADPEQTAMGMAARLVKRRAARQLREHRVRMLQRLRNPSLYAGEGSSEERLEMAFASLFYGFLTGDTIIALSDAFYQVGVAVGGEEIVASLLPPGVSVERILKAAELVGGDETTLGPHAIVSDEDFVRMINIPYLARALRAMRTADFEREREESRFVADAGLLALSTAAALLPGDGLEEMLTAENIDWHYDMRVAALPLLFAFRRKNAPGLEALLARLRESLPTLEALLSVAALGGSFAEVVKQHIMAQAAAEGGAADRQG